MTRSEIDEMWGNALHECGKDLDRYRFAEMVAEKEREACAKLCDDLDDEAWARNVESGGNSRDEAMSDAARSLAEQIRARGKE